MSSSDLFALDFPHGTPAGWDRGCKGTPSCQFFGSVTDMTCAEARRRFVGDYAYRVAVLGGSASTAKEFVGSSKAKDRRAIEGEWSTPVPVPETPLLEALDGAEHEEQSGGEEPPAVDEGHLPVPSKPEEATAEPEPPRRRGRPPVKIMHGTNQGYRKGCRQRDQCPAALAGGDSCTQAHSASQRKAQTGPVQTSPAPARVGLSAENAALKERVAMLELELDVAKSQIVTSGTVEVGAIRLPARVEVLIPGWGRLKLELGDAS